MAFNGTWKGGRSENKEQFMEKMGVNAVLRKLGDLADLTLSVEQTGDTFKVKENSPIRTNENEFTLGIPFDYTLPGGTDTVGTWIMEGDKMKGTFTRKDNGGVIIIIREIIDGELVQSFSYDGVQARRFFTKV